MTLVSKFHIPGRSRAEVLFYVCVVSTFHVKKINYYKMLYMIGDSDNNDNRVHMIKLIRVYSSESLFPHFEERVLLL